MAKKKRETTNSDFENRCDINYEIDKRGFCINCDFEHETEISAKLMIEITLHYMRELCNDEGLIFEDVLLKSLPNGKNKMLPMGKA